MKAVSSATCWRCAIHTFRNLYHQVR